MRGPSASTPPSRFQAIRGPHLVVLAHTVPEESDVDQANRACEIVHASLISHVTEDVDTTDEPSAYKQRQADGQCVRSGCRKQAVDSDYCTEHHEETKARQREWIRARRAKAKLKKLCSRCVKRQRRGRSAYCSTCLIQQSRRRKLHVTRDVDKSARVASRMIAWENSPQNAGRIRLRGGDRGRPTIEQENRLDVEDARKNLGAAVDSITLADSEEVAALPAIQRRDVRRAAAHQWLLIARGALVIAKRNGAELPPEVAALIGDSAGDDED
jgi:hypothetical protein